VKARNETEGSASGRALRLGVKQAHARDLPGLNEIPVRTNSNHKQISIDVGRHRQQFGVSNGQDFAIGEVQLKGAKRCPVAHFLEVRSFHVRVTKVNVFCPDLNTVVIARSVSPCRRFLKDIE